MNSTIKLYQVQFAPERNAWIDDIAGYLSSMQNQSLVSDRCQYIKHGLDISIKLDMPQSAVNNFGYNYVSIQNADDTRIFYYFIINTSWRAQSTIELQLSMDTINTFQDKLLEFDSRTQIKREHLDRFYDFYEGFNPSPLSLPVIINEVDEGLGSLPKFKEYTGEPTEVIRDEAKPKENWYLIYNSDKNISTTPDEIVPVSCYLCASKDTTFFTGLQEVTLTYQQLLPNYEAGGGLYYYAFIDKYNSGKKLIVDDRLNGAQTLTITKEKSVVMFRQTNNHIYCDVISNDTGKLINRFDVDPGKTVTLKTANIACVGRESFMAPRWYTEKGGWYNMVSNLESRQEWPAGQREITIAGIDKVDRTLTTLIKIIELPYAPADITASLDSPNLYYLPDNWEINYTNELGHNILLLKMKDISKGFLNTIDYKYDLKKFLQQSIPAYKDRVNSIRRDYLEPKLLNSSFYNKKFIYDNFSKPIRLEDIDWYRDDQYVPTLKIDFKPTSTMNSNFLFNFKINDGWYRSNEDYEGVLIASRSNEYPIYNSAYLNYLRTGYQFDKEKSARASAQRNFNLGLSVASTVGAAALSFVPGAQVIGIGAALASGLNIVKNIQDSIYAQKDADAALAESLEQARLQGASVEGSNDLDLLNYYNGNKLLVMDYNVSRTMQLQLFDLFFRTGYTCNFVNTPQTDTRRSFNFLQCNPVFANENDTEVSKYIDDIKARYQAGVTYFHKFYNGSADIYDFDQQYENWETWICPREKQNVA